MRMIIKFFLASFIFLFFFSCGDASKELINKCKELEIGMNYNMIIEKMGQPLKVDDIEKEGKKKMRLYFPSPKLSSTFIQCVIDKESNLVEEIICNESYSIKK